MTARRLLPTLACAVLLSGCAPDADPTPRSTTEGPRVVSLAPHLTELAFSAGAGERLVGVVEYSDFPEAARRIPRVGDAFNVDFERLGELAPDLILAWKSGTPAPVRERLEALGYEVVVLETITLEDVPERLIELGQLIGDEKTARTRADRYRHLLRLLRSESKRGAGPGVFYQISLDPLYTVGGKHYISEIIGLCGGQNIFADIETPAAAVSHEAVLARNPQIILTDRRYLVETRAAWSRFMSLGATRNAGVHGIDADLVARPTLRLADGARQVCAAIGTARAQAGDLREGMQ